MVAFPKKVHKLNKQNTAGYSVSFGGESMNINSELFSESPASCFPLLLEFMLSYSHSAPLHLSTEHTNMSSILNLKKTFLSVFKSSRPVKHCFFILDIFVFLLVLFQFFICCLLETSSTQPLFWITSCCFLYRVIRKLSEYRDNTRELAGGTGESLEALTWMFAFLTYSPSG